MLSHVLLRFVPAAIDAAAIVVSHWNLQPGNMAGVNYHLFVGVGTQQWSINF